MTTHQDSPLVQKSYVVTLGLWVCKAAMQASLELIRFHMWPLYLPTYLIGIIKYSHTSVLVSFRTHQTLYSLYFDKKKMFKHLALAQDLLHLLELTWVTTLSWKRKCFIVHLLLGAHWFQHFSQVLEWITEYKGAMVFMYYNYIFIYTMIHII